MREIVYQLSNGFVWEHLPNSVKWFSVKLECLLEQDFVFNAPLVRKGSEIWQVLKWWKVFIRERLLGDLKAHKIVHLPNQL